MVHSVLVIWGCVDLWLWDLDHLYLFDECVEFCIYQSLDQAVCNHLSDAHVGQFDLSCSDLVSDIMVLDVNVLGSGMEDKFVLQSN